MKLESIFARSLSVGLVTLGLAACGGGGGSSTTPPSKPPVATPTPTPEPNTPPVISSENTKLLIEGDPLQGFTVEAADAEGNALTFSVSGGDDANLFQIGETSGLLEFISPPDFENPTDSDADNVYQVDVTVTDTRGDSDSQSITFTIENGNDIPEFSTATALSMAEGASSFSYLAAATDPNGDSIAFSITGGADKALFSIDQTTGELSFSLTTTDYETPSDADQNNVYEVRLTAGDDQGGLSHLNFELSITNINEAPAITSLTTGTVAEGALSAYTITATDPENDSLTYAITGGADAGFFTVNATTGVLSLKAPQDYETPADANGNRGYEVTISATDPAGLTANSSVEIQLQNINEAPIYTGTPSATTPENRLATGYTATATDVDPSDIVSFIISGGTDANHFSINSTTGELSFIAAPDYDVPADSDTNNTYQLDITAKDRQGLTASQSIIINVTDENEAPAFTSTTSAQINEGQTAILSAQASDPENDTLTYSISGGTDAALFSINATTGALTFNSAPNFESPADSDTNNQYSLSLTVKDTNNLSDSANITITVANINEAPSITSAATTSTSENLTATGYTASATDEDDADSVSFTLGGTDQSLFTLSSSGELSFIAAPDFEQPGDSDKNNQYELTITAKDNGGEITTQALTLTVTNGNDAPTISSGTSSGATASVEEGTTNTGYIIIANDVDNDTLTLSVTGTDAAQFTVSANGELQFTTAPDYELPADNGQDNTYNLTVTASDGNGGTAEQSVIVTVTNRGPYLTELSKTDEPAIREGNTIKAQSECEECSSVAYEWYVGDTLVSTSDEYTVSAGDVGAEITLKGTPSDGANDGDTESVVYQRSEIVEVASTWDAFAALKSDGTVVTWGRAIYGGESFGENLTDVVKIVGSARAFAALRKDGTIETWGHPEFGGDNNYAENLTGVEDIALFGNGFAALLNNKTIVTWESENRNSSVAEDSTDLVNPDFTNVEEMLTAKRMVQVSYPTAVTLSFLRSDNTVVYANPYQSVIYSGVDISNVVSLHNSEDSFIGLNADGSLVSWGERALPENVRNLTNVIDVAVNESAYSVLTSEGEVISWGDPNYGGDVSTVTLNNVIDIEAGPKIMVALMKDGSLVHWGDPTYRTYLRDLGVIENPKRLYVTDVVFGVINTEGELTVNSMDRTIGPSYKPKTFSNIKNVYATKNAFAMIDENGEVDVWGRQETGGFMGNLDLTGYKKFITNTTYAPMVPSYGVMFDDGRVEAWGFGQNYIDASLLDIPKAEDIAVGWGCVSVLSETGRLISYGNYYMCETNGQSYYETGVDNVKFIFSSARMPGYATTAGGVFLINGYEIVPESGVDNVKRIAADREDFYLIFFNDGSIACHGNRIRDYVCDIGDVKDVKNAYLSGTAIIVVHNDGTVTAHSVNGLTIKEGLEEFLAGLVNVDYSLTRGTVFSFVHFDGAVSFFDPNDVLAESSEGFTIDEVKFVYGGSADGIIVKSDSSTVQWGRLMYPSLMEVIDFSDTQKIIWLPDGHAMLTSDGRLTYWGDLECIECIDIVGFLYIGEDEIIKTFDNVKEIVPSNGGFYIVKNDYSVESTGFVPAFTAPDAFVPKDKILSNTLQ